MNRFVFRRPWPRLVSLLLALSLAAGCAGSHGSLKQKTRWYKSHKGGPMPCPCGH